MPTSKKLRLLITPTCNRSCEGCCNKDWDITNLPVNEGYAGYETIMLTGGEPMLYPHLLISTCADIRAVTDAPIILYTAKSKRPLDLIAMLNWVDGITLTLHEQYDVRAFVALNAFILTIPNIGSKSLRLNVFSHVDLTNVNTSPWVVKDGIEWIDDCPLPDGEVLRRL